MKDFVELRESYDEDDVAEEMAEALGVDVDDIEVTDDSNFGIAFWIVEEGRREYYVFEDEDDAEAYAVGYVEEMIEDDPSVFNQDFLGDFIYVSATDIRMLASDLVEHIYEMDDEDAVEYADMEDEYEEALEDGDYDRAERIADKARENYAMEEAERIEGELENDPIGFLVDDQGLYDRRDIFDQPFIQLDTEKAAQYAVRTDGVAHFLAGYDGDENETDGGLFYYRNN